jgi:hypothetical protein
MTKDKDVKRLARERADRTGEAYSTARRQLVDKLSDTAPDEKPRDLMRPWMGLDEAARLAAPLASDEARIAGHPWVEPEHLLLGLLSHGGILPVLRAMRVSPVAVRHHVERLLPPKREVRVGPTLSAAFQWTLALGREEATRQGRAAVSTEDLLVAVSRLNAPVAEVLREYGASEARLREHLGYEAPPADSMVRAAIVSRLLPLLGQSVDRVAGLVRHVTVVESGDRAAISIESEEPNALARFADDVRLEAEMALGRTAVVNITGAE